MPWLLRKTSQQVHDSLYLEKEFVVASTFDVLDLVTSKFGRPVTLTRAAAASFGLHQNLEYKI